MNKKEKLSLGIGRFMKLYGNALKWTGFGTYYWLKEKGNFESVSNEFNLRSWGKKGGYPLYAINPNTIGHNFYGTKPYKDKEGNSVSIPADIITIESPRGFGVPFNSHGLEGEVNYQFRYKIKNDVDAFKYQIELDGDPEGLRQPVRSKLLELMSTLDTTGDIARIIREAEDLTEESEIMIKEAMAQVDKGAHLMKKAIDPNTEFEQEFIDYLKDKYGISSVALDISGINYDDESRRVISIVLEEKREADARMIRAHSQADEARIQAEATKNLAKGYIEAGRLYKEAGSSYGAGDIALELQGRDNLESIAGRENIRTIVSQTGLPTTRMLPFPDEDDKTIDVSPSQTSPKTPKPQTPSPNQEKPKSLEQELNDSLKD